MILGLIKKEIVANVLSLRFMITFVLFFLLILLSIFVMSQDYEAAMATHQASKADHNDRLSALDNIDDDNKKLNDLIYDQGVYSTRTPNALMVFAAGLEKEVPTLVHTSMWASRKIDEQRYRNPIFSLFATPDYSYIVTVVVSLLSLLFVYDAVCGEKERGTLKVVLCNSVPRDLVLLSKWIGGYITLALPFLISLLGGITYVYLSGLVQLDGEILERLGWITGASLLYISLFFALGMMISTLTEKSSTALLISLFIWVCWVLVIPNLSPVITRSLYHVPNLQKINQEKAAIDHETDLKMRRVSRSMLNYGKKAQELRDELQREGERRKKRLDKFYQDKLKRQIEYSKTYSRISPSASYTYITTDLASTGLDLFASFKTGYHRFQKDFRDFGENLDDLRDEDKLPEHWFQEDQIPVLILRPMNLEDTLDSILTDVLLLAVFNVLFFMLSYLFFLRYDVT